jgi:hypothetical protein
LEEGGFVLKEELILKKKKSQERLKRLKSSRNYKFSEKLWNSSSVKLLLAFVLKRISSHVVDIVLNFIQDWCQTFISFPIERQHFAGKNLKVF